MKLRACLKHLQGLTALRPRYADNWNNLALALCHSGRHSDALTALNRALEINPLYFDATVSRCFALAEVGRTVEALRELRELSKRLPDDYGTLVATGVFCMRHDWPQTGLAQLLRAERLKPRVPFLLSYVAAALGATGDAGAAEDTLARRDAILTEEGFGELLGDAGPMRLESELYSRWENPLLAQLPSLLADHLCGEGKAVKAERELARGNARFPGHPLLMTCFARLLAASNKPVEAERWLVTASSMDPLAPAPYFELGFLLAQRGELEGARRALERALELRPLYPDFRYHLGTLLVDLGLLDHAIAEFERVLTLNPNYAHCALHLASAYMETGACEAAEAVLAGSACAEWPEALLLAAQLRLRRGDRDGAAECLERVVAREDTHVEARELLESLRAESSIPQT